MGGCSEEFMQLKRSVTFHEPGSSADQSSPPGQRPHLAQLLAVQGRQGHTQHTTHAPAQHVRGILQLQCLNEFPGVVGEARDTEGLQRLEILPVGRGPGPPAARAIVNASRGGAGALLHGLLAHRRIEK
jgi:hypothetical protein